MNKYYNISRHEVRKQRNDYLFNIYAEENGPTKMIALKLFQSFVNFIFRFC
jgi:hypothetical protein